MSSCIGFIDRPYDGDPHTTDVPGARVEIVAAVRGDPPLGGPRRVRASGSTSRSEPAPSPTACGAARCGPATSSCGTSATSCSPGRTRHLHGRDGHATRSTAGSASATTPGASATTAAARSGCGSRSSSTTGSSASGTGSSPTAPASTPTAAGPAADGSDPVPIVDFEHDVEWVDADGRPRRYGEHGEAVAGLARDMPRSAWRTAVDSPSRPTGTLRPAVRAVPTRRAQPDDACAPTTAATGTAIYEVTGARHHRFFPDTDRRRGAARHDERSDRRHAGRAHAGLAHRRAQRAGGHLDGAQVVGRRRAPLGTGQMCDSVRLSLTYDGPHRCAHELVAKLPAADETSRATALACAATRRRSASTSSSRRACRSARPTCSTPTSTWRRRSFVLLLEDLAPAAQGDQLAGCTPDVAEVAVRRARRAPRPAMGRSRRSTRSSGCTATRGRAERCSSCCCRCSGTGFASGTPNDLGRPRSTQAGDALFSHLERVPRRRQRPGTVVHGDYRLDNLLLDSTAGGAPVARRRLADVRASAPARADVAYFIGAGLLEDDRRERGGRPRPRLPRGLVAAGVRDFGWDAVLARVPARHVGRADHGGRRIDAGRADRPRRPDVPRDGRAATPATRSTSTPPHSSSDTAAGLCPGRRRRAQGVTASGRSAGSRRRRRHRACDGASTTACAGPRTDPAPRRSRVRPGSRSPRRRPAHR